MCVLQRHLKINFSILDDTKTPLHKPIQKPYMGVDMGRKCIRQVFQQYHPCLSDSVVINHEF